MTMTEWAEREITAACKRENPNWDGKSFDYGCSCYQSALKAYKSLMGDNHSGYSFAFTKEILKNLLDSIPLTPIVDNDFFSDNKCTITEPSKILERIGLKSRIQCPRRFSLYREEDLNGNVRYDDIDRYLCVDAVNPSNIYSSGIAKFINKLYPITMPYIPNNTPFKVYIKSWTSVIDNKAIDVNEILGYTNQQGEWCDYHKFIYYDENKSIETNDNELIEKLITSRTDTVEISIVDNLISHIKDVFLTAELYDRDKNKYMKVRDIVNSTTNSYYSELISKSRCLLKSDKHDVCYFNTPSNHRIIVKGSNTNRAILVQENKDIKELIKLVDEIRSKIQTSIVSV